LPGNRPSRRRRCPRRVDLAGRRVAERHQRAAGIGQAHAQTGHGPGDNAELDRQDRRQDDRRDGANPSDDQPEADAHARRPAEAGAARARLGAILQPGTGDPGQRTGGEREANARGWQVAHRRQPEWDERLAAEEAKRQQAAHRHRRRQSGSRQRGAGRQQPVQGRQGQRQTDAGDQQRRRERGQTQRPQHRAEAGGQPRRAGQVI
jgi:hypothetical protein